jgi:hypothetical protein
MSPSFLTSVLDEGEYCNRFDQHVPGNSTVNTVQHATINEAVFSMSSAPNSGETTGLCKAFVNNGSVNTLSCKQ